MDVAGFVLCYYSPVTLDSSVLAIADVVGIEEIQSHCWIPNVANVDAAADVAP